MKVAWGVITKGKAEDVRSDDEDDDKPAASRAKRLKSKVLKGPISSSSDKPAKKCNPIVDTVLGGWLCGFPR